MEIETTTALEMHRIIIKKTGAIFRLFGLNSFQTSGNLIAKKISIIAKPIVHNTTDSTDSPVNAAIINRIKLNIEYVPRNLILKLKSRS
jgi:hypothetical protein